MKRGARPKRKRPGGSMVTRAVERVMFRLSCIEDRLSMLAERRRGVMARLAGAFLPPPFPGKTMFWIVILVVVGVVLARAIR